MFAHIETVAVDVSYCTVSLVPTHSQLGGRNAINYRVKQKVTLESSSNVGLFRLEPHVNNRGNVDVAASKSRGSSVRSRRVLVVFARRAKQAQHGSSSAVVRSVRTRSRGRGSRRDSGSRSRSSRLGVCDSSPKVLKLTKLATERMSFGSVVRRNRRCSGVLLNMGVSSSMVDRLCRGGGNGHASHISGNVSL